MRQPQRTTDHLGEQALIRLSDLPREHEPPPSAVPRWAPHPVVLVVVVVVVVVLVPSIVPATSAVQRGGAPVTRGRIDRPCKRTFRGGAPWPPRFRRQHDLTSAHRCWPLHRSPSTEHAPAQHLPRGTVPVPSARDAAASKDHRPPRRASCHGAQRPTPRARAPVQRSPTWAPPTTPPRRGGGGGGGGGSILRTGDVLRSRRAEPP